ncbi:MAG TPA: hypothetical protein PLC79_02700, partial [Phycisphaerae bacterium]|nr:hypothetical protein [Phycisphaerae bacterium]
MRIDANGDVGIGTTTPATRLEVVDPGFTAVRARNTSATGIAPAIEGFVSSADNFAAGIVGRVQNATPGDLSAGVVGVTDSTTFRGAGVWGIHFAAGSGVYGSAGAGGYGVFGNSAGIGVNGLGDTGVKGTSNRAGIGGIGVLGVAGTGNVGVRGESSAGGAASIGVIGESTTSLGIGIKGVSPSAGVQGFATSTGLPGGIGVYGQSDAPAGTGVKGLSRGTAIHGVVTEDGSATVGVLGEAHIGPDGLGTGVKGIGGITGVYGTAVSDTNISTPIGVLGEVGNLPNAVGVLARAVTDRGAIAIKAESVGSNGLINYSGYAGQFYGKVWVGGALEKAGGGFKIDHPLDPEKKYLSHSFVESPDMKNVYDGVVTTDARGYATITLPDWFEALNRDFRYQLTVLDETDTDEFVQAKVVKKL